jgi:hypothetical protein
VVVRGDSSVTGVEFNIQDSDASNDDATTGKNNGNGLTNGVLKFASATQVTPDPIISQQYPNAPLEYRFNYVAVPSSGTATITVKLKEFASSAFANRVTYLTRTVNTLAPVEVMNIVTPSPDGTMLILNSNDVYVVQACFTSTLTTNDTSLFSLYINGILQPRSNYVLRPTGCGAGLRTLYYNWSGAAPGTNILQLMYTNQVILSDARMVRVTPPFNQTTLTFDGKLLEWASVPGINYQILATTNLLYPMSPIAIQPASGASTFFVDPSPDPIQKYYRVQIVP